MSFIHTLPVYSHINNEKPFDIIRHVSQILALAMKTVPGSGKAPIIIFTSGLEPKSPLNMLCIEDSAV